MRSVRNQIGAPLLGPLQRGRDRPAPPCLAHLRRAGEPHPTRVALEGEAGPCAASEIRSELLYWVPCNEDEIDPHRHVSLIYDGRESLTQRVWRLKGKQAHAQRPKSRLLRVVSNVVVERVTGDEIEVSSAFVLGDVRNAVQTVYFGRTAHTLTRRDGVLRMKRKKVMLLNNDAPLGNLTFLL